MLLAKWTTNAPLNGDFTERGIHDYLCLEWDTVNDTLNVELPPVIEISHSHINTKRKHICKLMESLLREEILTHVKKNMFSKRQFGFKSGRSTALQLIKVLDNWTCALDEGMAVDVVYCDFMKAFDRVPHKRLMKKSCQL
ncbi:uncharacterized protein [Palaemon carinicauda]|uniref:uncharacterized protein n=1 Tax=Palaemon carinicauda TaxID=392227 RepID=UPI0035B6A87F